MKIPENEKTEQICGVNYSFEEYWQDLLEYREEIFEEEGEIGVSPEARRLQD